MNNITSVKEKENTESIKIDKIVNFHGQRNLDQS